MEKYVRALDRIGEIESKVSFLCSSCCNTDSSPAQLGLYFFLREIADQLAELRGMIAVKDCLELI